MPIAEGGTNTSSLATTDGTLYFDGSKLVTTATGSASQVLTSNGAGVAPSYQASAGRSGFSTWGSEFAKNSFFTDLYVTPFPFNSSQVLAQQQWPSPMATEINYLFVKVSVNNSTTNATVTLNVNGVNTALSITAPALTTGTYSDLVNAISISAGDLITFHVVSDVNLSFNGVISCKVS